MTIIGETYVPKCRYAIKENTMGEENLPAAQDVLHMPTSNPVTYLNSYMKPENKTTFLITSLAHSIGTIKLTNYSTDLSKKMTTLYGRSKNNEYEVTILANQLLSLCLGTKTSVYSLKINGKEMERNKTANGEPVNFKIEMKSFNTNLRLKKIQEISKNEILQLYTQLPPEAKKKIDDLIERFYNYEVNMVKSFQKNKEEGKQEKYTDWTGYYAGSNPYERLCHALSSFSTSLLYPVGNAKVSNDTLLVNITSAVECPSADHGTCLLHGVCYAIGDAKRRFGIRHRDRMLHIMNMICLYSGRMDIVKNLISEYIDSAREFGFNVQNIRLNEAGDFIDQRCISEYSKMCGEINTEKDVKTTAYSARTKDRHGDNMDFSDAVKKNEKGIPNIILTMSRADEKSVNGTVPVALDPNDPEGGVKIVNSMQAADRFFLAVPQKDFDALEDTGLIDYGHPDLKANDHFVCKANPRGLYYKCGCELDKQKTCGDCHVCYTPNDGDPYFVICKMHGASAGKMNGDALDFARELNSNPYGNEKTERLPSREAPLWTADADEKMRADAEAKPFSFPKPKRDPDMEKKIANTPIGKPAKLRRTIREEDIKNMVRRCLTEISKRRKLINR